MDSARTRVIFQLSEESSSVNLLRWNGDETGKSKGIENEGKQSVGKKGRREGKSDILDQTMAPSHLGHKPLKVGHKSSIACGTLPQLVVEPSHTTHLFSSRTILLATHLERSNATFGPSPFLLFLSSSSRERYVYSSIVESTITRFHAKKHGDEINTLPSNSAVIQFIIFSENSM